MSAITNASNAATEKMRMVAAATEEMSATINEVARNTEKQPCHHLSGRGSVPKPHRSKVDRLGRAAQEISQITEVITEISEQTNPAGPERHHRSRPGRRRGARGLLSLPMKSRSWRVRPPRPPAR